MPKSNWAALVRKRANCTGIGSLSPSSSRRRKRSSSEVSCPTIWLTGSPTKRNSVKAMRATVTMTMAASKSRRMANASIYACLNPWRTVAAEDRRRGARPRGVWTSTLLHLHPVEQDLIIGALHHLYLLGDAPDQRLLMQRDDPGLLVVDAEGLGDQLVTLLGVRIHQDQLVELGDPGIAVAAEVEGAAFAVGIPAADDVLDHVPAIERARRPAQQIERGVVLVGRAGFLEVLRLRHGVELHLDVDAGEHLRHGLTDALVVDVAVVRAIHRDLEAAGIAGIGQQLLRGGDVIGVALELGRTRVEERRDHQCRIDRHAAHHLVVDRFDVDRLIESLAHARILEGVLALDAGVEQLVAHGIHIEEDGADLGTDHHRHIGTALDAVDVLDRDRVHHVDVAGQQRGDARGVRLNGLEDHLVEVVLRLAPPTGERLEHGLHAGLVTDDGEGARTIGLEGERVERGRRGGLRLRGAVRLRPLLGEHVPGVPFGIENGIGRAQHEIDRVVVDLDGLHVGGRASLDLRAGATHPLGGEDDVVGSEVLAVVELDALAQVEAPLEGVDDLPALGQPGDDLEVLVALGETLHDIAERTQREALVQRVGIERVEVALEGVAEGLGRGWRGGEAKRKRAGYDKGFDLHLISRQCTLRRSARYWLN